MKYLAATPILALAACLPAVAQEAPGAAAQANNPLANFTALNFHDYYIGELTAPEDKSANQFWVRFAKPFKIGESNWLLRASLPVNSSPVGSNLSTVTGFGDINAFAAYLIDTGNPAVSFGVGPLVNAPSGKDEIGSGKWSAGFANVLFNAESAKFQYGYLLTWQHSFAGDDDRADVNLGAFQPFAMYQLGNGTYLRSTGIMAYNFENDGYSIPLGFGVGKVIQTPGTVYNIFIEPQWSVADEGPGWPEWQVFVGFNMQFAN